MLPSEQQDHILRRVCFGRVESLHYHHVKEENENTYMFKTASGQGSGYRIHPPARKKLCSELCTSSEANHRREPGLQYCVGHLVNQKGGMYQRINR